MNDETNYKTKYEQKPWIKFYPEGTPTDIEIPERSLPEIFDETVEKRRNKTALIFYGAKISYQKLGEHVDKFATALNDLGVKKGDRIALYLLNSPQFIIAYFGALKVGASLTPISPVYVSSEVKHQIEDSGAKTIVCQDILYDYVEKAKVELRNVVLTNIGEYLPTLKRFLGKTVLKSVYRKMELPASEVFEREGFYQLQKLINEYPQNPPSVEIDPEKDIAVLPYTGGTTGLPKGVMLSHHNLIAAESLFHAFFSTTLEEGKEVVISYLPFYHIYGQIVAMLQGLIRGYTLVLFTTPDLDDILHAIESYKATAFFSVPTMYELLKDYDKTDRVNWKRLKILTSGGDALLESTARDWERRTGVKIHEGYGMSETASASHFSPVGRPKISSFGVPVPTTMAAVIHPERDEFLPPGEIGELAVQGPQVTKGYWKRSDETGKMLVEIDGERWLRTGDLVKMDEEGYFYFYDRKRDLIKYKGYSIFAREVEEVLSGHPKIKEAGVVGVPNPKVGENIKAVVVLETDARGKLSEEEIIKYCEERLAHYKVPKIVEFRGEIPKTDVGKVSHRELREELE